MGNEGKNAEAPALARAEPDHTEEANRLLRRAAQITLAVAVVAIVAVLCFIGKFGSEPISPDVGHWGQVGDFFGGVINPAVGLATVLLIFIGIHIQRTELRATELQLAETASATRIQNFENALFSWLERYQSLIESVEDSQEKKRGRDALRHWYQQSFTSRNGFTNRSIRLNPADPVIHDDYLAQIKDLQPDDELERAEVAFLDQGLAEAIEHFAGLYEKEVSSLDAPFRTLYRMVRWIDESKFSSEQKWHYVALVRAQLSWIEMVYFLFNGMTEPGEKFIKYADRYALFDNLAPGGDINVWFARWNHQSHEHTGVRCHYRETAFSSRLAKQKMGIAQDV